MKKVSDIGRSLMRVGDRLAYRSESGLETEVKIVSRTPTIDNSFLVEVLRVFDCAEVDAGKVQVGDKLSVHQNRLFVSAALSKRALQRRRR